MKRLLKKVKSINGKIIFFILFALVAWLIGGWLWGSWRLDPDFITKFHNTLDNGSYGDIAVEFHGMIFDIILFGIILTVYEAITAKRNKIRRYKEELEDFRGWSGEEASFRVAGIVRRLLNEGVKGKDIDLSYLHVGRLVLIAEGKRKELIKELIKIKLKEKVRFCSMQGVDLTYTDLQEVDLSDTNLQEVILSGANLQGAILSDANLQGARLLGTNLQGARLSGANLQGAILSDANLQGAIFSGANLQGAMLLGANLQGADLRFNDLKGANLLGANLKRAEAYNHQKESFRKVITEDQLNSIRWLEDSEFYELPE